MIDVALAYPFSLGMLAAFNPCGFAMLPTYLVYFITDDTADGDRSRSTRRGLLVGLCITASFVVVFGVIGIITRNVVTTGAIEQRLPWITLVLGGLLVPLGIAMLAGYEPRLDLPRLDRGGRSRNLGSVFVFGVSFAVVSFGCAAPLFLSNVTTSFTDASFADGIAVFVAYAIGMGSVVLFLTLALSTARDSIAGRMRGVLPYVNRVAGGLLVLAGLYVASYGWYEIQVFRDPGGATTNAAQDRLEELQNHLNGWIVEVGATHVGVVLALAISGLVLRGLRPVRDTSRWRTFAGAWTAVAVGLEVLVYRGEMIVLPALRLLAGLPERAVHWFTDPSRAAVPLEMIVIGSVAALGVLGARRFVHGAPPDRVAARN